MKNFIRALKFAWPYRTRLILSIVCAVFAAALWSLNFTAIYPILKIFGTDHPTLQAWVDSSIREIELGVVPSLEKDMGKLKAEARTIDDDPDEVERIKRRRHLAGQ